MVVITPFQLAFDKHRRAALHFVNDIWAILTTILFYRVEVWRRRVTESPPCVLYLDASTQPQACVAIFRLLRVTAFRAPCLLRRFAARRISPVRTCLSCMWRTTSRTSTSSPSSTSAALSRRGAAASKQAAVSEFSERAPPSLLVAQLSGEARDDSLWSHLRLNLRLPPRTCQFISKTSNFLIPIIGWSMYLTGHVPLKRMDRRSQMVRWLQL